VDCPLMDWPPRKKTEADQARASRWRRSRLDSTPRRHPRCLVEEGRTAAWKVRNSSQTILLRPVRRSFEPLIRIISVQTARIGGARRAKDSACRAAEQTQTVIIPRPRSVAARRRPRRWHDVTPEEKTLTRFASAGEARGLPSTSPSHRIDHEDQHASCTAGGRRDRFRAERGAQERGTRS